MASGKAIGEFSLKIISVALEAGPAGSILNKVNFEGTATGFGAIFETATFIGGPRDGTFNEVGVAYLDNGEALSGIGHGSYESNGKHRWATSGIMDISDGRRIASTGEIDLASRTWKGALTE